jgi:anaerobic selenocysteine-containing dehydrogenase
MAQTEAPEVHAAAEQGDPGTMEPRGRRVDVEGTDADADGAEPADDDAAPRPAMVRFQPGPGPSSAAPVDQYSLRLVTSRKLYDEGTLVQHAPSLAPLAPGGILVVHPAELERVGIAPSSQVRVSSGRGSVNLPVAVDPGLARGVAVLWFNLPGSGAADLIDATAPVTEIRIERAN